MALLQDIKDIGPLEHLPYSINTDMLAVWLS